MNVSDDLERSRVLSQLNERAEQHHAVTGRPFVTLSYAQSLNGAIAGAAGQPVAISGRESLVYTHALRAMHDAILVGIGTVMTDDPALTTRLVDGPDPRRVILDSHLRISPDARVLMPADVAPLVVTTAAHDPEKARKLERRGVRVVCLSANERRWVDLQALLSFLGELGIKKLMVEGGSRVIGSFIETRCVHHVIITLSMMLMGGRPLLDPASKTSIADRCLMRIEPRHQIWAGADFVLHGDPLWEIGPMPSNNHR